MIRVAKSVVLFLILVVCMLDTFAQRFEGEVVGVYQNVVWDGYFLKLTEDKKFYFFQKEGLLEEKVSSGIWYVEADKQIILNSFYDVKGLSITVEESFIPNKNNLDFIINHDIKSLGILACYGSDTVFWTPNQNKYTDKSTERPQSFRVLTNFGWSKIYYLNDDKANFFEINIETPIKRHKKGDYISFIEKKLNYMNNTIWLESLDFHKIEGKEVEKIELLLEEYLLE